MYYVYFIDNLGRMTLTKQSNNKKEIIKQTEKEMSLLDPDTNRTIIITTTKRKVENK